MPAGVTICRPSSASATARKASASQAVIATTGRSWITTATRSVSTSTAGCAAAGVGTARIPSVLTTASERAASRGQAVPPTRVAIRAAKAPASSSACLTPVVARASVHQYGTSGSLARAAMN